MDNRDLTTGVSTTCTLVDGVEQCMTLTDGYKTAVANNNHQWSDLIVHYIVPEIGWIILSMMLGSAFTLALFGPAEMCAWRRHKQEMAERAKAKADNANVVPESEVAERVMLPQVSTMTNERYRQISAASSMPFLLHFALLLFFSTAFSNVGWIEALSFAARGGVSVGMVCGALVSVVTVRKIWSTLRRSLKDRNKNAVRGNASQNAGTSCKMGVYNAAPSVPSPAYHHIQGRDKGSQPSM